MQPGSSSAPIVDVSTAAYVIPTEQPESDGTLEWDRTTLVLARVHAGGEHGLGYSYAPAAAARVITDVLRPAVMGIDSLAIPQALLTMRRSIRNLGQPGVAYTALSAVDAALWDLKGKLLGVPVITLLGAAREAVPLYGSGGFTSYTEQQVCEQLAGWVDQGLPAVKMKVGRDAAHDSRRVQLARRAIGDAAELFVDANGAYDRKLALARAEDFASCHVHWFEEPVSSDDLAGLRWLRERGPAGMQIAAGEYGYTPEYFERMLQAQAVDVIQADATRCGGISGFAGVATLAAARSLELSAHCAPALHMHVGCAVERIRHLEYFHDHVRIERMLFDGLPEPRRGQLAPDRSRPGLGLTFKASAAQRFEVRV